MLRFVTEKLQTRYQRESAHMTELAKKRPEFRNINALSDLPTYRLPPAGWVSILHRISGLLMFLLMPFIIWMFDKSVSSEVSFAKFRAAFNVGLGFVPGWLLKLVALALIGVLVIVFVETGLLVGFFLPGDSLLFVTGLMIAGGFIQVPIWLACILISAAAFAGDQTGYFIGRKAGPAIFNKPESRFFSQKNVSATNSFFERYGARAIILAHFVPVMRTFVPVAAGVGRGPCRCRRPPPPRWRSERRWLLPQPPAARFPRWIRPMRPAGGRPLSGPKPSTSAPC